MNQVKLIIITIVLVCVSGCGTSYIVSEQNYHQNPFVVATADNDYELTMDSVYSKLYHSRLLDFGGVLDTTFVREYSDSLVLDTLIGFEAYDVNLADFYERYRIYKIRYFDIVMKQFFQKAVYERVEIDSLDVVEYYYNNEDLFSINEQVNLYHIYLNENNIYRTPDSARFASLSVEDQLAEVGRLADSVHSLITSSEQFPEIAKQFSDDMTTNMRGGYVGWTERNTYPDPFDSVAFSLDVGEISKPYRDRDGWHIIMIDNHYPAGFQPLNENLYVAAVNTYHKAEVNRIGGRLIDSLLSDFDVKLNPEILGENIFILDGKTWGAIINGKDTIDCNEGRSYELTLRSQYSVDNTDDNMKMELFRKLGERYVFLQAAREMGIEEDSLVAAERNKLYHKYCKDVVLQNRVDSEFKATDSMVEAYYNANLDKFVIEKPLKVQHIIVEDSVYGEFLRDQAMSGVDFLELAEENYPGEESIRRELADLGFISRNDVSPEFYDLAVKTEVGTVSHPIKTEFGYHIVKVLEFKATKSIEDARGQITPILKKQHARIHLKAYQDKLFEKYNVMPARQLYEVHLKPRHLRK